MKNKDTKKKQTKEEAERFLLTDLEKLPLGAVKVKIWLGQYNYRYTTGPFLLPENSGSLDWTVINNDSTSQRIRVTVFRCPIGTPKYPMPPGPLEVTVNPGECTHNGNTYPVGFAYEIQIECNSKLLFPYVSVWPGNYGVVIPGMGITSSNFIQLMP